MMLQVTFYRPDLKTIHPGYINASQVVTVEEALPAMIDDAIQMVSAIRFSNNVVPCFVLGSIDEIAAYIEGALERGRS